MITASTHLRVEWPVAAPSTIRIVSTDPHELMLWSDIAQQRLFVRALGRRWFVDNIEWERKNNGAYVGEVHLREAVDARIA